MFLGRVIVKAILFPYSNKLVTKFLDGQLNAKFGVEFGKILERTFNIIREDMHHSNKKDSDDRKQSNTDRNIAVQN